jgi:hypothetical protein
MPQETVGESTMRSLEDFERLTDCACYATRVQQMEGDVVQTFYLEILKDCLSFAAKVHLRG